MCKMSYCVFNWSPYRLAATAISFFYSIHFQDGGRHWQGGCMHSFTFCTHEGQRPLSYMLAIAAHPPITTFTTFPSVIGSSHITAGRCFRCWHLSRLLGCRTGLCPHPRIWVLWSCYSAEPAAGWTPVETLSVPDMLVSSPEKYSSCRVCMTSTSHQSGVFVLFWVFWVQILKNIYRVTANDLWQEVGEVLGGQGDILAF